MSSPFILYHELAPPHSSTVPTERSNPGVCGPTAVHKPPLAGQSFPTTTDGGPIPKKAPTRRTKRENLLNKSTKSCAQYELLIHCSVCIRPGRECPDNYEHSFLVVKGGPDDTLLPNSGRKPTDSIIKDFCDAGYESPTPTTLAAKVCIAICWAPEGNRGGGRQMSYVERTQPFAS